MPNFVFKALAGAVLAIGLAAMPASDGFSQEAAKAGQTSPATKSAKSAESRQDAGEPKAKKPLTAQQQKMKDCGAKWQEEKKAKGVKGREAWNKFRSDCLKS